LAHGRQNGFSASCNASVSFGQKSDISRWLNERSSRRERQRQAHSCTTNQALIARSKDARDAFCFARQVWHKAIDDDEVDRLRVGLHGRLMACAGGVYEAGHFRRHAVTLIGPLAGGYPQDIVRAVRARGPSLKATTLTGPTACERRWCRVAFITDPWGTRIELNERPKAVYLP
jgi:hypothetical protein